MVKFGFRKARFMCVLALFVLLQGCAVQQLNSAIMSGANPVSNQLIRAAKNDGSLNSIDAHGETPLFKAVALGQVHNVRKLLTVGADPNLAGHGKNTPLGEVAMQGHIEIARLLLDAGADVDGKNSNGMAPLAAAAQKGHSNLVELLISRGAEIDLLNGRPPAETALLNAIIKGHVGSARILLDAGADPNFVHAPTGKRLTDLAREAKAWSVLAELEEAIKHPPVRVARVRERPKEPALTTLPEPRYTKSPVAPSGDYTRRHALVIGNSRYKGIAALKNATNDARAIRSALSTAGFEVIYRENASLREMNEAVRAFSKRIQSADVSAFFYAGHAVQVDGQNYLLPIDVDVAEEYEISYEAYPLDRMLASLEKSDTSLNMVFLDACRNNPYSFSRSATRGIAMTRAPSATLVSYATAPDDVAMDGTGLNSPYTKHLVDAIGRPGASLVDVIDLVQRGVRDETGGRQRPWVQYDVLPRDFVFVSE